ncbi:MetS family NSS transporter small subunit [Zobellella sp. An-6]
MVIGLGITWGGAALCIYRAIRQRKR